MGEASMGGAPSSSAAAQSAAAQHLVVNLVVNRTLSELSSELSRVAASGGAGNPSSGSQDVSQGVMLLASRASRNFDVAGLGADVMDLASDMATQGAAAQAFTPLGETPRRWARRTCTSTSRTTTR